MACSSFPRLSSENRRGSADSDRGRFYQVASSSAHYVILRSSCDRRIGNSRRYFVRSALSCNNWLEAYVNKKRKAPNENENFQGKSDRTAQALYSRHDQSYGPPACLRAVSR